MSVKNPGRANREAIDPRVLDAAVGGRDGEDDYGDVVRKAVPRRADVRVVLDGEEVLTSAQSAWDDVSRSILANPARKAFPSNTPTTSASPRQAHPQSLH